MIVIIGAPIVVFLVALRLRPKPVARAGTNAASPARPWHWMVGAGVVAMAASPLLSIAAAIGGVVWHRWARVRREGLARRQISTRFPDALDLLVLSIRAGYLPAQAVVEIAPYLPGQLRPSFTAVSEAMQRGERFADALLQLRARLGPIAQPLVDSLSAADRYGLPLTPVLERLAFEARQQRRRDADATARELPVRLAMPLVLCTLPSFVLLSIVPLLLGALSSLHT